MTATTATTYGAAFSYEAEVHGILSWLRDGGFTPQQEARLVDALMFALREEVDERLPGGTTWQPFTSEFVHNVGVQLPDSKAAMDELFREAWTAVEDRFKQIEALTIGTSPV